MTMGDRLAILDGGELQQTGRPRDVYERPRNEFVGGFVGSPSMNTLPVVASGDDSGVTLSNDRVRYDLSGERARRVADAGVEEIHLGVRPEDVRVVDSGGIDTVVEVVEPVGSDNYLYLDLGPDFIARVDADVEPAMDDRIQVTFDERDVHLFDARTGDSLLYDGDDEGDERDDERTIPA